MRAGHRQGGGVGGCSSGVVCENHLVGSEFSEGMRTHAHTRSHALFEYPPGEPSEAKLLKEIDLSVMYLYIYFWGLLTTVSSRTQCVNYRYFLEGAQLIDMLAVNRVSFSSHSSCTLCWI